MTFLALAVVSGALWLLAGAAAAQLPMSPAPPRPGALAAATAEPGASPWAELELARVRLVAGVSGLGTLDSVPLGLEFAMAPGWKIYWRTPGDAGYPPRVDWTGSANLAAAVIQWPAPERFSLFGLETAGYGGRIILPVQVKPTSPAAMLHANAHVEFLTCNEICVPLEAKLALALPADLARPTSFAHDIDQFRARVPGPSAAAGIALDGVALHGRGRERRLVVTARAELPFTAPDLFIEGLDRLSFGKPSLGFGDGGRIARLSVPVYGPADAELAGAALTLTVTDGADTTMRRAAELSAAVAPPPPAAPLALMVALALLGGLILNLMPCVVPVLALKLAGIVGIHGQPARQVRAGFLAAAAGIVVSFVGLAAALIAVKSAGLAVGWGIQFQHPLFLATMAGIILLFAANLWNLFEIPLPVALGAMAQGGGNLRGLAGHFFTGVFAAILATPCSAPFLGTAVGFALAGGPTEIVVIFITLGLGLALPYLVVAAVPRTALALPRPGRWMIWLRRALGLALAATALWLLSVLAAQQDHGTAGLAGLSFVVAIASLASARVKNLAWLKPAAAIPFAIAIAIPIWRDAPAPAGLRDNLGGGRVSWVAFDRAAIDRAVAEGKTVLVDVTADWCLTCQINKQFVLERGRVAERLNSTEVIAMRADWTRPSDIIADYLASFGRYGIPFNAVYGPAAPAGIALPELLTADAVLGALDSSGKTPRIVAK